MKKIKEASIELYGGCNFKCVSCPQSTGRESDFLSHLDFELFVKIVSDLKVHGCESISLQGSGEPLMHKDIARCIAHLYSLGIKSHIITNGALLSRSLAESIVNAGISTIRVSILGTNQQQYSKYMGTSSKLDKVLSNIEYLMSYIVESDSDCKVSVSHLILDSDEAPDIQINNYRSLTSHIKNLGIEVWYPHNWAGASDFSSSILDRSQTENSKRSCGRPQSDYLTVRAGGLNGSAGAVVPCCFTLGRDSESVLGHLSDSTLDEILDSQKFLDLLHAHETNDFSTIPYCDECDQLFDCPSALAWTNLSARKEGASHTAVFDEEPVIFKKS